MIHPPLGIAKVTFVRKVGGLLGPEQLVSDATEGPTTYATQNHVFRQ